MSGAAPVTVEHMPSFGSKNLGTNWDQSGPSPFDPSHGNGDGRLAGRRLRRMVKVEPSPDSKRQAFRKSAAYGGSELGGADTAVGETEQPVDRVTDPCRDTLSLS